MSIRKTFKNLFSAVSTLRRKDVCFMRLQLRQSRLLALVLSVLLLLPLIPAMPAKAYSYRENGVDVSVYQGDIDWQMLAANNNLQFVIMRACKLLNPTSEFFVDTKFEENYAGARAIGLKVGVYCYCGANSREGILETTQNYINTIQGKTFDYPVYLDVESDAMTVLPKDELTTYLIEALDMLRDAGFNPGIYANLNWFTNYIDGTAIRNAGYDLWLARYTHNCDSTDFSGTYDVWQYSDRGTYSGMTGTAIDLDVSYVNYQLDGDHGRVPDTDYSPYLPLTAYLLSNENVQPFYADMQTPIPGAAVFPTDACIIREIYQNGWCKFTYPVSGGSKVGFLPLERFLTTKPADFQAIYSPAKVYTHSSAALDNVVGYIGPHDTLYITDEDDEKVRVIYSITGGKKIAWLSKDAWNIALLFLLQNHIHNKAVLRDEQLAYVDIDKDGQADVYDLALLKHLLDGLAIPEEGEVEGSAPSLNPGAGYTPAGVSAAEPQYCGR